MSFSCKNNTLLSFQKQSILFWQGTQPEGIHSSHGAVRDRACDEGAGGYGFAYGWHRCPTEPDDASDWEQIEAFAEILNRAGYASPIRTPRGRDIFAACGQLKSESVKMRASEKRKLERGEA